jgi:autotransporter-associated beta strand protein
MKAACHPALHVHLRFIAALLVITHGTIAHAATVTKSATGTDLADGASWGGTAPGSGDVATWTSTSLGASLTLDSNATWGGISITGALSNIGITGAGTLTLGAGGIDISASAVNLTVANPLALDASQTWTVQSGRTLTASGIISGGFVLTKAGTGTLTVTVANSHTGGTLITGGTLSIGATDLTNPLGPGTTTVSSGGTLGLNKTTFTAPLALSGGTVTSGNSFSSSLNGPLTLSGISTIHVTGNLALNGNLTGTGGLTKTGGAFVPLTGASNDYTGPTTIGANGGGLTVKSSLYGNDPAKWTPANITVNSGGALVLNVGGAGEFTIAQAGIMFSQLGGTVDNNGLKAGSIFGVDTRTAGGTFTIADNLTDSNGPGGGAVGFRYVGNGTTGASTLELTGDNTYSGPTIVDRHGTLKVSSLNSVNGGSPPLASSSLGRPTTVANGTIQLGSNASFQGGSLTYTGSGETTDRVLNLGGANNTTYRLDQSGSGLLKFTSPFTITDNRGIKTIELQGSTAGTGEIAGPILNGDPANPNRLTKSGTGTWTLSGANYYAGITTLNAGVISVATISDGGLTPTLTTTAGSATVNASSTAGLVVGQTVSSSKIPAGATIATVVDSTTFTLNSGTGVTAGATQVSTIGFRGNLGIAPAAAANLVFNGGTLQYTGSSASTNRNFTLNAGKTAVFDITANNLTLAGASTNTTGALTKTGAGTLTLAGANLATGATTVNQGTLAITGSVTSTSGVIVNNGGRLLVNNPGGSGTGNAAVTVNSGGTLGGSGTINGTVTVNSGGTVALGDSGSTLSLASATSPTFNASGTLKVSAASNTLDRVFLTNSSATFACGNLDLVVDTTDLARAFGAVEIVRTAKASGISGTFRSVTVIGNPAYTASVSYAANSLTLTVSGGSSSLPAAYKIQVAGSGSATTTAGTGVDLTITALDALGATLAGFSGVSELSFYGLAASPNSTAATVSDNTGAAQPATLDPGPPNTPITFVNGIATTSGSNNGILTPTTVAGSAVTVHCSDGIASSAGGVGAAGLSLSVNPAAIASYVVSAGSPQGNGATFVTTVTAKDAYGNTVTTDNSTVVTMTSSTGNAQFDSDGNGTFGDNTKTLSGGAFSINTKNDVVETLVLTATSGGGKTGTSSPITIATSSAKDILTFTFPTLGAATISGTNITLTVPFGTNLNLAPTYTLSTLATCSPASGSTRNFATPQTYTVTAQDLSTKDYTVTLTVAPEPTTFTWNSASSGNWSVASNWTNNSGLVLAPNASGSAKYVVNFNQAGTYTPDHDLNNNFLLNQLNLAATVTLSGNSLAFSANGPTLPQLNQNSSSAVTLSTPLNLAAALTVGGGGNGTVTLASLISGPGSLTKNGSGTLTVNNAANTFSGGTIINSGQLTMNVQANAALGTGPVTLNAPAILYLERITATNALTLNGGTIVAANGFGDSWNGPVTVTANTTIDTPYKMTFGGAIAGAGGFVKTGGNQLVLAGANSFTGTMAVPAGTLSVASFNRVSGGTATSNLGAPASPANGTISLGSAATAATLDYSGPGETTDRVIKLAGTTGGATLNQSGTTAGLPTTRGVSGQLNFTADLAIPGTAGVDNRKTLTLTSTAIATNGSMPGSGEISGAIGDSVLGISAAQRATSVTKAGPNTWILSGSNTYTGATTIQAGVLAFTRATALGGGALTISTGAKAKLDYIGTRQVSLLTLNGISQPNGTYGSTSSNAANKNDTWFSGPGTVTVGPIATPTTTTLALTSGANPSNGGAALTFTATVAGPSPGGSVMFYDGLTLIGTAPLNGSSQASLTTSTLSAGTHSLTAFYPGNVGNSPSASAELSHTVVETRPATAISVTLTAGTNPSSYNAAVTFTATVAGATPTGTVTFHNGTAILGTAVLDNSGLANLTTRALTPGWSAITASYPGDAANAPSRTASTLFQTVNPPPGNGKLKIFILTGQSNMQGKGSVENGRNPNNPADSNFPGGLGSLRNMLNKYPGQYGYLADPANPVGGNPGWQTRGDVSIAYWSDPQAFNDPVTGTNRRGNLDTNFGNVGEGSRLGPEYGFGITVGSQLADQVLIIKYAFGGKSLAVDFRPPGAVAARGGVVGPYYTGMLARVNQVLANLTTYVPSYAGGGYEIAGFGWHQGWNDRVNSTYVSEYEANLTNLIHDLRTALNAPNLPVSIGNTGMANAPSGPGSLIEAQGNVADPTKHPEFAGTVATVDTRPFDFGEALGVRNEGYHWNWNSETYYYLGEGMGKAMMAMLPPLNALPGATSQNVATPENTALPITLTGSDPEHSPLSYTIVTHPVHGTLSGEAPNVTYTPTANYHGPDSFTFASNDGTLDSDPATVSITVTPSPYSMWAADPAQGLTAGVNGGPQDDPDRDGIVNLMEFVLGGAPMVPGQAILPRLEPSSGGVWTFEYDRSDRSLPPATIQVVEYGNDLTGWTPVVIPVASGGIVSIAPGSPADRVQVTLPAPGAGLFVRLKVTR